MSIQKAPCGDYYVFQNSRTEIIVKEGNHNGGIILNCSCPKELIGRTVRLKVEFVKKLEVGGKEPEKEVDEDELPKARME